MHMGPHLDDQSEDASLNTMGICMSAFYQHDTCFAYTRAATGACNVAIYCQV